MKTIGFIGAGNMAEAIMKGVLAAGMYSADQVYMSDVRPERLESLKQQYGINVTGDNAELVGISDVVILSVKPQVIGDVLTQTWQRLEVDCSDKLVISIVAGKKTDWFKELLGAVQFIRVMPNTPAMVSQGAAALYSANASPDSMDLALRLFSAIGRAVVVDDESQIDAVTAVSGSGPAYYFLMMEKMIEAAIALGLDAETARTLTIQTAKGAAILAEQAGQTGEGPDRLRQKVTSPNGTTQAALEVFGEHGFGDIVNSALTAARDRSVELSG